MSPSPKPQQSPAPPRTRLVRRDGGAVEVLLTGVRRTPLRDTYFTLLSAPWWQLLLAMACIYVLVNALFAVVYVVVGGVEGARPGSFEDAFFFSVQTMATIGYGSMYPRTSLTNALVTGEALIGLLGVAMSTGVLFAKFARPVSQLCFSKVAIVALRDGVPSLQFRVGNERKNHVVEASIRVVLVRNEKTEEGETVRRWHELSLYRSMSPVFALSWTVVHAIDDASPLKGATRASLIGDQSEIVVIMSGTDITLAATIHARHSYLGDEIYWDHRFVDVLSRRADGKRVLDFTKFHDVEPIARDAKMSLTAAADRAP